MENNPYGCWDFYGYSSPDYFNREGIQMKAVKAMVDRLITKPSEQFTFVN